MEMTASFIPPPSTQIKVSTGKTFAISFLPLFSTQTRRLQPPHPCFRPCPLPKCHRLARCCLLPVRIYAS